jgi:hypothetical protein
MKGMGQIVSWSVRDESLHCEGIIKPVPHLCAGTRMPDQGGEGRHHRLLPEDRAPEDAFIDLAFEQGPVPGMSAKDIKRYIRYIADWRLGQLGFQPIYMIEEHPLPGCNRCSTGWSTPTSSKHAPPNIRRAPRAATGTPCGPISIAPQGQVERRAGRDKRRRHRGHVQQGGHRR